MNSESKSPDPFDELSAARSELLQAANKASDMAAAQSEVQMESHPENRLDDQDNSLPENLGNDDQEASEDAPATTVEQAAGSSTRLLKFDEDNTVNTGKDINIKINDLDESLAHLRAELGAINSSVEEGLDRLSDTDTDLTAKVSETYKRLGEIDNAYKSLLNISSRIDNDIRKLNGDVSTVAQQSASGIKHLEQSSIAQSTDFAHKNQQVVSRVDKLVETSKLTGELMQQKIQSTTDKVLLAEQRLITEIEKLASKTDGKTDMLEGAIDNNKARLLKMQHVDEAIIKRATTLEISSAELNVKSQELKSAVGRLEKDTGALSSGLNELQNKIAGLEATTNSQGSLIRSLQSSSSRIKYNIAVLGKREDRHFKVFAGSFLALIIAATVMFFSQHKMIESVTTDAAIATAENKIVVDNTLSQLQQSQADSIAASEKSMQALEVALQDKVSAMNASLKQEMDKTIAATDSKMQVMQDQIQSVEGRLTGSSAFNQIGNDNIIHGRQWISSQPANNYTVQVAYVADRAAMFERALSYNDELKDTLSWFEVTEAGVSRYVLLSGSYADRQSALASIQSMPAYMDRQQPVLRRFAEVQQYLTQQ